MRTLSHLFRNNHQWAREYAVDVLARSLRSLRPNDHLRA